MVQVVRLSEAEELDGAAIRKSLKAGSQQKLFSAFELHNRVRQVLNDLREGHVTFEQLQNTLIEECKKTLCIVSASTIAQKVFRRTEPSDEGLAWLGLTVHRTWYVTVELALRPYSRIPGHTRSYHVNVIDLKRMWVGITK